MEQEPTQARDHGDDQSSGRRSPPRPHPKPDVRAPASLNQAVRQQLWYLDTMMAMPFRTVRRMLGQSADPARGSPLMQGLDEMMWAAEGMSRLPLKMLQSAFGEEWGQGRQTDGAEGRGSASESDRDDDSVKEPSRAAHRR